MQSQLGMLVGAKTFQLVPNCVNILEFIHSLAFSKTKISKAIEGLDKVRGFMLLN